VFFVSGSLWLPDSHIGANNWGTSRLSPCFHSPRYWVEVFHIHDKYEERELRIVKHSIAIGGGASAGEHWFPWLEHAHLPELIYAEYEIWEIMREEDREIEELRERWGCK
jgi:hypothetical protein